MPSTVSGPTVAAIPIFQGPGGVAAWTPPNITINLDGSNFVPVVAQTAESCVLGMPAQVTPGRLWLLLFGNPNPTPVAVSFAAGYSVLGAVDGALTVEAGTPSLHAAFAALCVGLTTSTAVAIVLGPNVGFEVIGNDNGLQFVGQTDAAGVSLGTLANAPTAGDPLFLRVERNGVPGGVPWWPL